MINCFNRDRNYRVVLFLSKSQIFVLRFRRLIKNRRGRQYCVEEDEDMQVHREMRLVMREEALQGFWLVTSIFPLRTHIGHCL